jgi:osmotically-inducible protein OsmY
MVAQKRKTPQRRTATARSSRPTLLLVGNPHGLNGLSSALRSIRARLRRLRWSEDLPEQVDESTIAVLLMSPLEAVTAVEAVEHLRASPRASEVALFVIVPDGLTDAQARRLYGEGATAVFEWPREALVLPRCLIEMLAVDLVRGSRSEPDAALARTVRAHLKLLRGMSHKTRVQVREGVAVLSGAVEHLWQKEKLVELVSNIPGVKGVVTRALRVEPTDLTDAQVRRSIRRLLQDASEIDESTLALRVESGYVTLAGSVSDRRELNRVVKLLTNVKGVRGIERLVVVSPTQQEQDHRVARRLRGDLARLVPDQDVEVFFFGKSAVLSGQVDRLAVRRRIEEHLADDVAVDRVVNKIDVA